VDYRRLREMIGELYLENVSHACLERGPGYAPVESPRSGNVPGLELPLDLARLEIDSDYGPSRIGLGSLVCAGVLRAPIGRRPVYDWTVGVMLVTVMVVAVPCVLMLAMRIRGWLMRKVWHGDL
jgi:hypothetical protein